MPRLVVISKEVVNSWKTEYQNWSNNKLHYTVSANVMVNTMTECTNSAFMGRCSTVQHNRNRSEELTKLYDEDANVDADEDELDEEVDVMRANPPKNARNRN